MEYLSDKVTRQFGRPMCCFRFYDSFPEQYLLASCARHPVQTEEQNPMSDEVGNGRECERQVGVVVTIDHGQRRANHRQMQYAKQQHMRVQR